MNRKGAETVHVSAETNYKDAHSHLTRKRGSAKRQVCVVCDGPAREWALLENRAAKRGTLRSGWHKVQGKRAYWMHWSPDPSDYVPMCVACHRRMDDINHPESVLHRLETLAEHSRTMDRPRRDVCRNGHDLTFEESTLEWVDSKTGKTRRECRECRRARQRKP